MDASFPFGPPGLLAFFAVRLSLRPASCRGWLPPRPVFCLFWPSLCPASFRGWLLPCQVSCSFWPSLCFASFRGRLFACAPCTTAAPRSTVA